MMTGKNESRQQLGKSKRRAAAVVEFAVVLPVIILLFLGFLELGRAIMVNHALQETAQAACRLYAVRDRPASDASDIIAASMSQASIDNYSVQFDPATKTEIDQALEPVTVTISVNFQDVTWFSPRFMQGSTIVGQCVMPADVEGVATTTVSGG